MKRLKMLQLLYEFLMTQLLQKVRHHVFFQDSVQTNSHTEVHNYSPISKWRALYRLSFRPLLLLLLLLIIITLIVIVCCCCPALPFKFVEGLTDTSALTTQDVTLSCTLSKDDVQLVWKKNGQEIKPDGKKYEVVCDGTVHRLVIHDLQLDDDAEYQCCFGDDLSSCKLHVEGTFPLALCLWY